jgi:hypothetical protein
VKHALEAEGSLVGAAVVVSVGAVVLIGLKDDGLVDDEGTSDDGSVRDDGATDGDDNDDTVLVEGGRSMGL